MKHAQSCVFDGWEEVRKEGLKALIECGWTGTSKMLPMPPLGSPPFRYASSLLEKHGLKLGAWVIFARPRFNTQGIHADKMFDSVSRLNCAINIPIVGGPGSKMEWFETSALQLVTTSHTTKGKSVEGTFYKPIGHIYNVIDAVTFSDKPMLIDTHTPHRTISADSNRAVVSMRLVGNPTFEDVKNSLLGTPS